MNPFVEFYNMAWMIHQIRKHKTNGRQHTCFLRVHLLVIIFTVCGWRRGDVTIHTALSHMRCWGLWASPEYHSLSPLSLVDCRGDTCPCNSGVPRSQTPQSYRSWRNAYCHHFRLQEVKIPIILKIFWWLDTGICGITQPNLWMTPIQYPRDSICKWGGQDSGCNLRHSGDMATEFVEDPNSI